MTPLTCEICQKLFSSAKNLNRHRRQVHKQVKPHQCDVCGKTFSRRPNLLRHSNTHTSAPASPTGAKRAASPSPSSSPAPKRKMISESTTSSETNNPGCMPASNRSTADSPPSPSINKRMTKTKSKEEILDSLSSEVADVYTQNWNAIKTSHRPGKVLSTHTFTWALTDSFPQWNNFLIDIFESQNKRFKINFSHSFLLKNKESGDLSFYHASANNHSALAFPRLINSKQEFLSFLQDIEDSDMLGHVQKERPSSGYSVENIMATTFYFYHLGYPIG